MLNKNQPLQLMLHSLEWLEVFIKEWREKLLLRGMPGRDIAELSVREILRELGIETENNRNNIEHCPERNN